MRKVVFTFIFLFFLTVYGEKTSEHIFVFSTGYSLLHDYGNVHHSGFNIGFNFEPELISDVNVDISLRLHIFWKEENGQPLFKGAYSMCHLPSISLGPRYTLPFFKNLNIFLGAGIHMTAAIRHDTIKNETTASFGPGVYSKTGFDYIFTSKFSAGTEIDYRWSFATVPHTVSFNLRLGYIY
jgi:hypothetical protein